MQTVLKVSSNKCTSSTSFEVVLLFTFQFQRTHHPEHFATVNFEQAIVCWAQTSRRSNRGSDPTAEKKLICRWNGRLSSHRTVMLNLKTATVYEFVLQRNLKLNLLICIWISLFCMQSYESETSIVKTCSFLKVNSIKFNEQFPLKIFINMRLLQLLLLSFFNNGFL